MKNKKRTFTAILLTLTVLLSACLGVRVLRADRNEWRRYESIEARAAQALKYAGRKGMSTNYCVFVDYSIPSGSPRVFFALTANSRVAAMLKKMTSSFSRGEDRNRRSFVP